MPVSFDAGTATLSLIAGRGKEDATRRQVFDASTTSGITVADLDTVSAFFVELGL
jgi:hypothetical protein